MPGETENQFCLTRARHNTCPRAKSSCPLSVSVDLKTLPFCILLSVGFWFAPFTTGFAQSYTFTTLAGARGSPGTADGTNSDARFNYPSGLAVDSVGNVFVADTSSHTIRKLTPVGDNWVVSTVAGLAGTPDSADGTNSDARFNRPMAVALDNAGNLYVADRYNHTIRRIAPVGADWVVTTVAGLAGARDHDDGTNNAARFYSPGGIAVDGAGNLYVADTLNFTVRKIAPVGTNWVVSTIAGVATNYGLADGVGSAARFDYPYGITVDGATNLYVADWGNNAIRKVRPIGASWVVSTPAGSLASTFGSADGTNNSALFYQPMGIAVDQRGALYVADQYNHMIRKITPAGSDWVVSTIGGLARQSGTTNGTGSAARFNKPWGVAVGSAGNLFVADYSNQTIREGVPSSDAPPWLAISSATNQLVLSWPLSSVGFTLETSSGPFPGSSWNSLTNGVTILGNSFVLTNDLVGPVVFYRLRKPLF